MITNRATTARSALLLCLLAVLFSTGPVGAADSSLIELEDRINDLVYRISRSVVTVEAAQPHAFGTGAPGMGAVQTLVSTGIVCDTLGHVVVAATSVVDRDDIVIRCDHHVITARLVGVDYRTGLALLSAENNLGRPAILSRSSQCAGQMVVALGNAYGVRAAPSLGFCAGYRPDGLMQFSAPITSGSMGGGVFDLAGNLVGVIAGSLGQDGSAEVGLAVPAAEIPEIITHLLRHGSRYAGYIGVRVADFELAPGIELDYPAALVSTGPTPGRIIDRGILVTAVAPGSPAARAGLQPGDLLFSINGTAVASAAQLQFIVRDNLPGTRLEVGYLRREVPYVVQFETGRLETPLPANPFESAPSAINSSTADSLRLEIDRLKRAVQLLEQRLR